MFSGSTKPDDVLDWDALKITDTMVPDPKESVALNSATKNMPQKPEKKSTVTATERPPAKTSSGKVKPGTGVFYSVQAAALSNVKAAEEMTKQLRKEGFAAHIEPVELEGGKVLFRVRIDKFENRTDAEKALKKLVESGQKGFVAKQ